MTMTPSQSQQPSCVLPVLYSFRRCPYAMRARMATLQSDLNVELRDVLLKDKPTEMTDASPKATVPVLVLPDGKVMEESLDIMLWATQRADPENWYPEDTDTRRQIMTLIDENDGPFKWALDRYKYHVRFPEKTRDEYRIQAELFLSKLNERLMSEDFLITNHATLADVAIFPFIRQFANSDRQWFDDAPYPAVQRWLQKWTTSEKFLHIMKKRPIWKKGETGPIFPDLDEKSAP